MNLPKTFALVGPTASGKTELAMRLHALYPKKIHLISMDSAMLYKGMDIGSAKPTKDELSLHPHALVDVSSINDPWDLSRFILAAKDEIKRAHKEGKTPFLVGGSMLYLWTLIHGFSDLPPSQASIKEEAYKLLNEMGRELFLKLLMRKDPSLPSYIDNERRMVRAFCIMEQTQKPLSSSLQKKKEGMAIQLIQHAPKKRRELDSIIQKRTQHMVYELQVLEEVRTLLASVSDSKNPPRPLISVCYRQCLDYLSGSIQTKEALCEKICKANEKLVKHQSTWLKRFEFNLSLDALSPLEVKLQKIDALLQKVD